MNVNVESSLFPLNWKLRLYLRWIHRYILIHMNFLFFFFLDFLKSHSNKCPMDVKLLVLQRNWVERGWEGGSGWGIHVNPWLIHVNVWQKPLPYCKVISLQIIKINGKKKQQKKTFGFGIFLLSSIF